MTKAKPFIKWVGGKSQLINQLDTQLPADFGDWEKLHNPTLTGSNSTPFWLRQEIFTKVN